MDCLGSHLGRVQVPPKHPRYILKRLRLSRKEISHYYDGFSNRVLWPIFTLFLEKVYFDSRFWKIYEKVNEKFAQAVLEEIDKNDFIWVHDYHLSLVPRFLRDAGRDLKIAFFWHIPWVPWELFRSLRWRREILEGLLGADLIGFQTHHDAGNFLECVEREKGLRVSIDKRRSKIKLSDREIEVKAFPVGVDYVTFESLGCSESISKEAKQLRQKLHQKLHGQCVMLSIDRLDYSKGILNKLEAFSRFLERYPAFWGKVVLVQVATPTRTRIKEYRKAKRECLQIVSGRLFAYSNISHFANWGTVEQ